MGPICKACGGFDRERLGTNPVDILRCLSLLHQYGLVALKPLGRIEKARQCIASALIIMKKILLGAMCCVIHDYTAKREAAEKGASTRQAAKRRGGEKAAITHEACWLKREPVATLQEKHQEQTDQVKQR